MAKIPLRIYLKNIENLIERGNMEQAIVHAKNILQTYPKHTDTYRLLGKAYLESQRYSEASDILQRILSVYPDDFISHIGMSIIREDESNLDAAIWHMERAYEVQPFNPAVQDELRRLYGRRDGSEPPRIRLTRGALVRMYARGGLYQQAIAEIKAALAEEPQRIDLRVLLARMLYLNGQRVEATEVCSAIISKLPYCFEANSILAEILPGTTRAADAGIFAKRIHSLDPYQAYLSSSAPTIDKVPDQAVTVEEFVLSEGSMIEAKTPEWTLTAGVEWEETPGEELPSWLNTLAIQTPTLPVEDRISPSVEIETRDSQPESDEELLPDWMRSAGWSQSDHPEPETPPILDETETEALPGEVPGWLKDIAPATGPITEDEQERVAWLESILPGDEQGSKQDIPDLTEGLLETTDTNASAESVPEWLSGLDAETMMPKGVDQSGSSQLDDEAPWISDFSQGSEQIVKPEAVDQEQTAIPDWLKDLNNETEGTEVSSDLPDWLQSVGPERQTKPLDESILTSDISDAIPGIRDSEEGVFQHLAGEVEDQASFEAATPWIDSLAESEAIEEILGSQPEEATEVTSDWYPQSTETVEPERLEQDGAPVLGLEGLLNDLRVGEESEAILSPEGQVEQQEQEIIPTFPVLEENPETETISMKGELAQTASEPSTDTGQPDLSDMDAAMAWLESLAARQGADEETLTIPPDLRTDTPPDWISANQPIDLDEMETIGMAQGESLEDGQSVAFETTEYKEELPGSTEVIKDVTDETVEAISATEESTAVPDLSDMDAAMAWLESLAANQGADEATLITPAEQRTATPPDWISESLSAQELSPEEDTTLPEVEQPVSEIGFDEGQTSPAPIAPVDETPSIASENLDMDNAFAWLESLAARQGADEETLITKPEDRIEEVPEWIEKAAEQALTEEPVGTGQPSEWIQEFEEIEPVGEPDVPEEVQNKKIVTDWLTKEMSQSAPVVSADNKDGTLDDWLKGLEEEGEPLVSPGLMPDQQEEIAVRWEPIEAPDTVISASDESTDQEINTIAEAQNAMMRGNLDAGLAFYNKNIQEGQNLEDIIHDLRDALYRYPVDIEIWQTLGDAYARNNQLQDALDAYTKAEELLR